MKKGDSIKSPKARKAIEVIRNCRRKIDRFHDWSNAFFQSLMLLRNTNLQNGNVEFEFQWAHILSRDTVFSHQRIDELLSITKLEPSFFKGKKCLDAGCGNGRWTYAMLNLGAEVDSFDISPSAVETCKLINANTKLMDINDLQSDPKYDFVFCWGVLHHLPDPELGFRKVASQVKQGGVLHIMVYNTETQQNYLKGRELWPALNTKQRLAYCRKMVLTYGGTLHGWWDALNPRYNYSYSPDEIEMWFKREGFQDIVLTTRDGINMRGVKPYIAS
jgi:2-polyprenyl-3-methyl-5-hydroxy-6-metoxy-1,4-benzoquinol methylase